jgi:neurotransmitter:Na+ symporter, NSS family
MFRINSPGLLFSAFPKQRTETLTKVTESWGTRVGLILAMAGNAVGLGNFLRFPVQAVQNGGGAFIIPYIICFLIMGLPLLWIEWSIGRFGGRHGHHSTPFIFGTMFRKPVWKYLGVFGIFNNVAVAAYYCYIESWTLSYVYHSVTRAFSGLSQTEVAGFFNDYVSFEKSTTMIPYESVIIYIFCLLLNTWILSRGLKGGVEKVAKIGVPLLIIFGAFLALRGITLGSSGAPEGCVDCNAFLGLNYLWDPQFTSLLDPKVWLAAAGQIFFTLSIGMGTVHCYASYVASRDDIALNAMSAGWMNGFVEVVLGASIVIPIAVGYLGLDWVQENAGFNMAFQTMPYLFDQWGAFLAPVAGLLWFGLLFFAGITSSLAFGTPWLGFMEDEFDWGRRKSAWSFGMLVLIMGLPTVFFYNQGVFGEYDYWAGTVALVVFALGESLLFALAGFRTGWDELQRGSDIFIPGIFKPLMRYVTPVLLLFVFLTSLLTPAGNDWNRAFENLQNTGSWELDANSIIGKIMNKGYTYNKSWFARHFESETDGLITGVDIPEKGKIRIDVGQARSYYRDMNGMARKLPADPAGWQKESAFDSLMLVRSYYLPAQSRILAEKGHKVNAGDTLAKGNFVNPVFYADLSKFLLTALFIFLMFMVYWAGIRKSSTKNSKS